MIAESRRRARHWAALLLKIAVLAVVTLGIASIWWPPRAASSHAVPSAVVALGSGVEEDSSLDGSGSGRLRVAAREAMTHHVPLVTTRVVSPEGISSDSGQARVLRQMGFAGEWKIADSVVGTTRDEAVALSQMLPTTSRLEVVTSEMHARRACAAFEAVGFRVECATRYRDPRWWMRPFDQAYELLAVIKYRSNGWMH